MVRGIKKKKKGGGIFAFLALGPFGQKGVVTGMPCFLFEVKFMQDRGGLCALLESKLQR